MQPIFFFYIFWGDFFFFFLFVQYSALLHLPLLRFHCADGCWDRTQDRCNWCIGSLTTRLDLIHHQARSHPLTRLDLIRNQARSHPQHQARSHPHTRLDLICNQARSHPQPILQLKPKHVFKQFFSSFLHIFFAELEYFAHCYWLNSRIIYWRSFAPVSSVGERMIVYPISLGQENKFEHL